MCMYVMSLQAPLVRLAQSAPAQEAFTVQAAKVATRLPRLSHVDPTSVP
jgi:hypothetical protein